MEIELQNVRKTYGRGANLKVAVDNVSWKSGGGEIFGLLGPNGAGKTTMIRMMLDIIRPDSGQILLNGDPTANRTLDFKRSIGYLPEERGLYQKRKVMEVLLYFAALKGFDRDSAKRKAHELLERFELSDCANKKIHDLSKGMGQKIQIASCVLHDPDLVVLDEPFSGLDPVNTRLIRDTILDLRKDGKLVFLSTHMMAEVEALCDRIFMINNGQQVLYGPLDDIRRSYTKYEVLMDPEAETDGLPSIEKITRTAKGQCVYLKETATVHDLLADLADGKRKFTRLEEARMPIEDIFVEVVGKPVDSVVETGAAS
jgi:ABC-2 type transport system ATP-binding protein